MYIKVFILSCIYNGSTSKEEVTDHELGCTTIYTRYSYIFRHRLVWWRFIYWLGCVSSKSKIKTNCPAHIFVTSYDLGALAINVSRGQCDHDGNCSWYGWWPIEKLGGRYDNFLWSAIPHGINYCYIDTTLGYVCWL